MDKLPEPNAPKYIELVKTRIEDEDKFLDIYARFACLAGKDVIDGLLDDGNSAISKVLETALKRKGWNPNDVKFYYRSLNSIDPYSGREWLFRFEHKDSGGGEWSPGPMIPGSPVM